MNKISLKVLLGTIIFIAWSTSGYSLEPPHDVSNNIDCSSCHAAMGGIKPRYELQEAQCKSCHNPTGQASNKSDVGMHSVNGDSLIIDCGSCHDPHGPNHVTDIHTGQLLPNLSLIRGLIGTYVPQAIEPAIFQSRPGHFAFASANTPWTGICQGCHTQTNYHRNDSSSGHNHQVGDDCTTCHSHADGFKASGAGCLGCHSTAQGSGGNRRQIVGPGADFERNSQHVSDGTNNQVVTDADCVVCHDQSAHKNNPETIVLLKAPDGGASYVYDGAGASMETYCIDCHDADSSLAHGSQPFSDGKIPGNISQWWDIPSAHSSTSSSSLATEKCMACHGGIDSTSAKEHNTHGTRQSDLHSDLVEGEIVANDEESLCFACHDADGGAATDIESRFYAVANGGLIYHHPVEDWEQTPGREVECQSCHNHHAATAANPLRGVTGVDIDGNPVGPGTANPRQVLEYEICLKCHGDTYNASMNRTTNKRLDFATNNSAFHPVAGPGRNRSTAMQNQLLGGLTIDSIILCSDCHNSETTADVNGSAYNSPSSPKGNHGSNIPWNLRAKYIEDPASAQSTFVPGDFKLCLLCHDVAAFNGQDGNGMTNFNSGGDNFHRYHLDDHSDSVTCANCHYNNHGSQDAAHTEYLIDGTRYLNPPVGYKTRMVSFSPDMTGAGGSQNPTFVINTSSRERSCDVTCHGMNHENEPYTPDSGEDDDLLTY